MTTRTDELATTGVGGRLGRFLRLLGAFVVGVAIATVLATVLALAYESSFAGRVLPGVRVGTVDAAGLTAAELTDRLRTTYAGLGEGALAVTSPAGTESWTYAELGRAIDAEALAAEALAAGRRPDPLDRIATEIRLLVAGLTIEPRVVVDPGELEKRLSDAAAAAHVEPRDARVLLTEEGYRATTSALGRGVDVAPALAEAIATMTDLEAPSETTLTLPPVALEPTVSGSEAIAAAVAATRMTAPVVLALGEDRWTLGERSTRGWIGFATTPEGRLEPIVERIAVQKSLTVVARKVFREAKDAGFLFGKDRSVIGVEASVEGRSLDVTTTTGIVTAAVLARAGLTAGTPDVTPAVVVEEPHLNTAQATEVAPEMAMVSSWETYYPIGIKNGFGANIEIPTRLIDGTVIPAGGVFDFWQVTGDPSATGGYKPGGAIINGRTEPQGALAGGICSCSTTLFNAALRAGYKMGARMNHYYYIDRYPLGLDATVFISSGSWRQTMSWTNDTAYPVLIKGSIRTKGGKGWVRFELWSVPTGRKVELTEPTVKNIRKATTITELTADLPAGKREQIEWPADGKDVWVTRVVTDSDGTVIHTETFVSHYARVDGIIQVGTGDPTTTPSPSPTPSPAP